MSIFFRAFRNRAFSTRLSFSSRCLSTLVLAEHKGGAVKASSLSAVEAAKYLGEDNSESLLLAGSGPLLQQAPSHGARLVPSFRF